MVKILAYLPLALAIRNKRQASTDTIVSSPQDAFGVFVTTAGGDSHGCHCTKFGSSETGFGGVPYDDRDRTCKDWNAARLCLGLSGGVCENEATLTYTHNSASGCAGILNSCHYALCTLDEAFGADFDGYNSALTTVLEENSDAQCPLTPENPMHDSCCGNSAINYQRYNSERSRCFNGVVVITEDCPAGQQKNDNDVCEDCPEGLFSNGRGRCVPCNQVADIIVIYDGSGSMKREEGDSGKSKWWHQKKFVQSLVDDLEIGEEKTRVGAMQYNQNNKLNWWLAAGATTSALSTKVNGITHHDERSCDVCSQIAKSYDSLENFFGTGRAGLKRVVLSFGDGINGSDRSGLARGLSWMKANDVESFFIRIGDDDDIGGHYWDELVEFEDNFIKTGTAGWSGLDHVAQKMVNKICAANASL